MFGCERMNNGINYFICWEDDLLTSITLNRIPCSCSVLTPKLLPKQGRGSARPSNFFCFVSGVFLFLKFENKINLLQFSKRGSQADRPSGSSKVFNEDMDKKVCSKNVQSRNHSSSKNPSPTFLKYKTDERFPKQLNW